MLKRPAHDDVTDDFKSGGMIFSCRIKPGGRDGQKDCVRAVFDGHRFGMGPIVGKG